MQVEAYRRWLGMQFTWVVLGAGHVKRRKHVRMSPKGGAIPFALLPS